MKTDKPNDRSVYQFSSSPLLQAEISEALSSVHNVGTSKRPYSVMYFPSHWSSRNSRWPDSLVSEQAAAEGQCAVSLDQQFAMCLHNHGRRFIDCVFLNMSALGSFDAQHPEKLQHQQQSCELYTVSGCDMQRCTHGCRAVCLILRAGR